MRTLAIETSCDDTSIAMVKMENNFFSVEKILAYSQIQDHQQFGWVVPEIAYRLHSDKITELLMNFGKQSLEWVDFFSVTTNPWLPWSLLVWKTAANTLWLIFKKDVVWVNHINGHIFSVLLERSLDEIKLPAIVLTASWWHNDIYLVDWDFWSRQISITKLWQTLDDAAWEAFDKVSRMLGWPYPWWKRIWEQALKWSANTDFHFKRVLLEKDSLNFSFSWMKSQVYNLLQKKSNLTENQVFDICFEFQEAMSDIIIEKINRAKNLYNSNQIWIVWWVSANLNLAEKAKAEFWEKNVLMPMKMVYCTDNWAMIWIVWILKKMWISI